MFFFKDKIKLDAEVIDDNVLLINCSESILEENLKTVTYKKSQYPTGLDFIDNLLIADSIFEIQIQDKKVLFKFEKNVEDFKKTSEFLAKVLRTQFKKGKPPYIVLPKEKEIEKVNIVSDPNLLKEVEEIFQKYVTPSLASHGGSIKIEDVKDSKIYVRFSGGCQGCGQVNATLQYGIENLLKKHIPWFNGLVDVTDHNQGDKPYYS